MVEGNVTCPSKGAVEEVATTSVSPRVLLMLPPVGMEAQVAVDMARGC